MLESSDYFKWLPVILAPVLIITIIGFCFWFFARRRANSNSKKPQKEIVRTKTIPRELFPKNEYLSSPTHSLPIKSRSTSSSQLTNTDIAYLDKLVRTASDRSMWKRDDRTKDQHNQPRKVPSGQIHQKT